MNTIQKQSHNMKTTNKYPRETPTLGKTHLMEFHQSLAKTLAKSTREPTLSQPFRTREPTLVQPLAPYNGRGAHTCSTLSILQWRIINLFISFFPSKYNWHNTTNHKNVCLKPLPFDQLTLTLSPSHVYLIIPP